MNTNQYNRYLENHNQLQDPYAQWAGTLYLPPCSCSSPDIKCSEASNTLKFDFTKFENIDIDKLINLCSFSSSNSIHNHKSFTLCQKYSLHGMRDMVTTCESKQDIVTYVKSSDLFKNQLELLRNDLKLLYPLCGTGYAFRSKHTKTQIKFHIQCVKSRYYQDFKSTNNNIKRRVCYTNKPTDNMERCPFLLNLYLDLESFDWFIKSKNQCNHQFHKPIKSTEYKIGKYQLSSSMCQEINKLHESNASSSIQQNVLMNNNNVTVPVATIFNHQNNDIDPDDATLTDAEKLLKYLQDQPDISYFALYANSVDSPLLTIPKKRTIHVTNNINIEMTGYVRVYPEQHNQTVTPHVDSFLKQTLSDIIVRNKDDGNEVRVLLTVGWARNEDLAVLRKFPEVLKMDTTFKTNKEGRPLFNIVCKDSNNKLCTVFRCLLPSEKRSIFHSILTSVLPKVLGNETCMRIKFIITDGDSQEINACRTAIQTVFKNATHMTCLWHLIHRSITQSKEIIHPKLKEILRNWLFFTATKTESKEELDYSLAHLKVCFCYTIIVFSSPYSHIFIVLFI